LNVLRFSSVTVCFVLILICDARAADRVWLEPPRPTSSQSDWYPRAIKTLTGKVIDLDAKQLRFLVSGDEAETVIAAIRVLWIEPEHVADLEAEMIQQFVDGRYAESLSKLPSVLQRQPRPPVWRQQWITMLGAAAAWKSGRSKIALELVSQLDRRPLPPMSLAWLPVAWKNGVQRADAVTAAKARLSDPSPAVQLVAASWLLSSPDRNQASTVLRRLQSHDRAEIAFLAQILLWRTATPPQVIQSSREWQAKLEALPLVLQTGPTKTLIDKLRTAGQSDAANRLQWSLELTPIHPGAPRN
jgi:hypothetical protein